MGKAIRQINNRLLICAVIFFLFLGSTGWAATYYVGKTGSDSNPGTESQPWLTVQRAADLMVAGDRVIVGSGHYDERIATKRAGTASEAVISFEATGAVTVGGFQVNHDWISIRGFICDVEMIYITASHVTISECTIGPGKYFRGNTISFLHNDGQNDQILTSSGDFIQAGFKVGDYIYVSNVTDAAFSNRGTYKIKSITANTITLADGQTITTVGSGDYFWIAKNYMGILIWANPWPHDCIIKNTTIQETANIAITAYGHNHIIEGNTIENTAFDAIQFFGSNINIRNNYMTRIGNNASNYPTPGHADLFQTYGQSNSDPNKAIQNIVIEGNVAYDCGCQIGNLETKRPPGGEWNTIDHITFKNNIFIKVESNFNIFVPHVYLINNTFFECPSNFPAAFLNYDTDSKGIANYGIIINNMFIGGGDSLRRATHGFYSVNTQLVGFYIANNYIAQGVQENYAPKVPGDLLTLFASSDKGGINGGNPGFRNPLTYDLHLLEDSTAIDKGTTYSASGFDIDGNPRDSAWDIGAFEFVRLIDAPKNLLILSNP